MKSLTEFVNEAKLTTKDFKEGQTVYGAIVGTNKIIELKVRRIDIRRDDMAWISFDVPQKYSEYNEIEETSIDRDDWSRKMHKDKETIDLYFVSGFGNKKTHSVDMIIISTSKEGLKEAVESRYGGRLKELSEKINQYQKELEQITKEINLEFND